MEMPTPCQHCGETFDLNDGYGSLKWYPNIVICTKCNDEEVLEIERDEEIKEIKEIISNAEYDINHGNERLQKMGFESEIIKGSYLIRIDSAQTMVIAENYSEAEKKAKDKSENGYQFLFSTKFSVLY